MIIRLQVIDFRNELALRSAVRLAGSRSWLLISRCEGYNVRGRVWACVSEALTSDLLRGLPGESGIDEVKSASYWLKLWLQGLSPPLCSHILSFTHYQKRDKSYTQ